MLRIGAFAELTTVMPRLRQRYKALGVLSPATTDSNRVSVPQREQNSDFRRVLMYRAAGIGETEHRIGLLP
jgi:hypothetical protein